VHYPMLEALDDLRLLAAGGLVIEPSWSSSTGNCTKVAKASGGFFTDFSSKMHRCPPGLATRAGDLRLHATDLLRLRACTLRSDGLGRP
jgi:hypothetical protein